MADAITQGLQGFVQGLSIRQNLQRQREDQAETNERQENLRLRNSILRTNLEASRLKGQGVDVLDIPRRKLMEAQTEEVQQKITDLRQGRFLKGVKAPVDFIQSLMDLAKTGAETALDVGRAKEITDSMSLKQREFDLAVRTANNTRDRANLELASSTVFPLAQKAYRGAIEAGTSPQEALRSLGIFLRNSFTDDKGNPSPTGIRFAEFVENVPIPAGKLSDEEFNGFLFRQFQENATPGELSILTQALTGTGAPERRPAGQTFTGAARGQAFGDQAPPGRGGPILELDAPAGPTPSERLQKTIESVLAKGQATSDIIAGSQGTPEQKKNLRFMLTGLKRIKRNPKLAKRFKASLRGKDFNAQDFQVIQEMFPDLLEILRKAK